MKKLFLLLFAIPLVAAELQPGVDFSLGPDEHLIVHNRVLLKVNNRPLSVMDVARKMDLIFYQQFPNLLKSSSLRYQFYQANWQMVLAAMIDDQLILADAKERKIDASDGEVREAMERVFGNDPVLKLNELKVSFDEAYEMLKTDLIVQKLTGGMVHAKAITAVNPKKMKQLYEKKQNEHPPQDRFRYRVLSFRGAGAKESALEAHALIESGEVAFDRIPERFSQATLSEEYQRTSKEISSAHEKVLAALSAGAVSAPVQRKEVCYLFKLDAREREALPAFNEMERELKNQVLEQEIIEYNAKYRNWLRQRYGLSEKHLSQLIPDDLQPFALR